MVDKERQGERALTMLDAIEWPEQGPLTMHRDGLTLVFDARPALIEDRYGNVTGIDAWVRGFRAGREVKMDPHRRFFNPPTWHGDQFDPLGAYEDLLFDSIRTARAPEGWRTAGTVSTFTGDDDDGALESAGGVTYATALEGDPAVVTTIGGSPNGLGQRFASPNYTCSLFYATWDTSAIADTDQVTAAVVSLYGHTDSSTTDFTINARFFDWYTSGGPADADWVQPAGFAACPLLATFATAGGLSTSGYNDFTSTGLFAENINKTGFTDIMFSSSRQESSTTPTGDEFVQVYTASEAGTSKDPKLVVTHFTLASESITAVVATATAAALPITGTIRLIAENAAVATATARMEPGTSRFKAPSVSADVAEATALSPPAFVRNEKARAPRVGSSRVARQGQGSSVSGGSVVLMEALWDEALGWDEGTWDYNRRVSSGRFAGSSR